MAPQEITLEIEGTAVICQREILIANSDYFKAMLEGNFVERNQERIKLEGVNLRAMNIILTLLWNDSNIIENNDLLLVLQVACMLQFVTIKNLCVDKIGEWLSPLNCLEVWHVTEQLGLTSTCLRAKAMALEEFLRVKDNDFIVQFNFNEIYYYLGHIYLKTDNELTVFQTAMNWWYQNSSQYVDTTKMLLKLLSCIDFSNLLENHQLGEIMVHPNIAYNLEVTQILSCTLAMKNEKPLEAFSDSCQKTAKLLCKSRCRALPVVPCMIMQFRGTVDGTYTTAERNKTDTNLQTKGDEVIHIHKDDDLAVIYYDYSLKKSRKCVSIDHLKSRNLTGFKMMGYKESLLIYGGEYQIGKGNFNNNLWTYDTFKEKWGEGCIFPSVRRHFETCIVGQNLYVIGGSGGYRLLQSNMVCYNCEYKRWTGEIPLPYHCRGRLMKCCNFLDRLFILDVSKYPRKCGYFFNDINHVWTYIPIPIADDSGFEMPSDLSIFSYQNCLYIKGKNLVQLELREEHLQVVSVKKVSDLLYDIMEAVLCNEIVYTLYKYQCNDYDAYSLEMYNLETDEINVVFKDLTSNDTIDVDGELYNVYPALIMCSFQFYELARENKLVNECFE